MRSQTANSFYDLFSESLGLHVFGIGLILLTIGLRRIMKHGEQGANRRAEKMAEKVNR